MIAYTGQRDLASEISEKRRTKCNPGDAWPPTIYLLLLLREFIAALGSRLLRFLLWYLTRGNSGKLNRQEQDYERGSLVVGDPLKIDWVEPEQIEVMSYYPKVAVVYRVSDGKEDKKNWTPGTNKTSASFPKSSLQKILRTHTLELTAEDNHGLEVVMQFDMPEPTQVEQTCDVDVSKK